jgi:hypothetical protein
MRTISWISAAVFLLIAAAHAQDSRTTPTAPAHNTMVLTGCLGAGPDESTFKLTNATPNAQASASQPQAVATAGERAEYELKAEKNLGTPGLAPVDLKSLVGRQVEITARSADEPTPAATLATAGGVKVDPDPAKPVEKKIGTLTVTAVKQVLAACR